MGENVNKFEIITMVEVPGHPPNIFSMCTKDVVKCDPSFKALFQKYPCLLIIYLKA